MAHKMPVPWCELQIEAVQAKLHVLLGAVDRAGSAANTIAAQYAAALESAQEQERSHGQDSLSPFPTHGTAQRLLDSMEVAQRLEQQRHDLLLLQV